MQTHLIYGKMNSLLKYVAYEEELKPEVKVLQRKLNNCKVLRNQQVRWEDIKNIVGISRSNVSFRQACVAIKKQDIMGFRYNKNL